MKVSISAGYWHDRLVVNAQQAIFHQWDQLEASGCIQNFRIAAGEVEGWREGWFFADSDAYKWLDAAARISVSFPDPHLAEIMDRLIALLGRAQQADGYLFTYNQIHFPGTYWVNLQIEHELYCHGHLIEAGVSHYLATGRTDLLDIAKRAADRIVTDFSGQGAAHTPGHEEIEIALLRLYQVTGCQSYLDMARQFIEQRGRSLFFAISLIKQNASVQARSKRVKQKREAYLAAHLEVIPFQLPPGNTAKKAWNTRLRWQINALSGKYFQQHTPVRQQTVPVGHAVRFAYLETAVAMLARELEDLSIVRALERAWEHMVARRMYITGGIGSLPELEGFGRDYELDPEMAYAETCAALASLFWNWEMVCLTGDAKYSDLFEWQLYNAASVGMGVDGTTYLYNNPLVCRGGVTRQPWYAVPCCPSNISRTWADLGKYIYTTGKGDVWVHQYIDSRLENALLPLDGGGEVAITMSMKSGLPWDGGVILNMDLGKIDQEQPTSEFTLNLRQPGWAELVYWVNDEQKFISPAQPRGASVPSEIAADGYDPRFARWVKIKRKWQDGDVVHLQLTRSLKLRHASPRVPSQRGKVALTCGPLVYCLESLDNPGVDIFSVRLDEDASAFSEHEFPELGAGVRAIHARTVEGNKLIFIPYFLWGNRGLSQMTVWVNR